MQPCWLQGHSKSNIRKWPFKNEMIQNADVPNFGFFVFVKSKIMNIHVLTVYTRI